MMRGVLVAAAVALVAILAGAHATMASGQIVDNPGFKALPRAIHYDTPLVPKQGPKAVIVYGKNAPYTKTAAQAVQKAIQEWCGAGLEMVDDHAVTSDQTWLLNEAYLKTPLVVLGNARTTEPCTPWGLAACWQATTPGRAATGSSFARSASRSRRT